MNRSKRYDDTLVLPFGTKVKMVYYDPYGYLGRDLHPSREDLGFEGTVYQNLVQLEDGTYRENEKPGVATPEDSAIVYWAISPEGKRLELMSFEIVPV